MRALASIGPQEPRVVGPGFHAKVFAVVRRVPAGYVATYGQVAALLGSPRVARQVGFAMAGADHAPQPVPWHRIVNAQGAIAKRGDSERGSAQRALLEAEGVVFDARGRCDLGRFRWTFPDHAWPRDRIDAE